MTSSRSDTKLADRSRRLIALLCKNGVSRVDALGWKVSVAVADVGSERNRQKYDYQHPLCFPGRTFDSEKNARMAHINLVRAVADTTTTMTHDNPSSSLSKRATNRRRKQPNPKRIVQRMMI